MPTLSATRSASAVRGLCGALSRAIERQALGGFHGSLDVHRVHDGTLESFVADRLASGVTATTINRSLEVDLSPKLVDHARERAQSPSAQPIHPTTTSLAAASRSERREASRKTISRDVARTASDGA